MTSHSPTLPIDHDMCLPPGAARRMRRARLHALAGMRAMQAPGGPGPGRHGPFGAPGFGAGFGPGFGGPRGGFGRRARRARRGDVRIALLLLLAEEPRNGYGLMQEIERRSDGRWRPSPGSVYPALAQLEDEGLVRSQDDEATTGRIFVLADAGRAEVEARDADQPAPWEAPADGHDDPLHELRALVGQLAGATMQVAQAGDAAQVARARDLLAETRRGLYRILADDERGTGVQSPADTQSTEDVEGNKA